MLNEYLLCISFILRDWENQIFISELYLGIIILASLAVFQNATVCHLNCFFKIDIYVPFIVSITVMRDMILDHKLIRDIYVKKMQYPKYFIY